MASAWCRRAHRAALDYRWLFWIPSPRRSPRHRRDLVYARIPPPAPRRVNWLGAVLLSAWLVALLLPLSQAGTWGWGSARVLGLFGAAVVLFALWLVLRGPLRNPLIDLRVMRLPAVWTTNAAALLFGAGDVRDLYAFLPGFVQTPSSAGYGFGASVTAAGLLMLPMLIAMFFAGRAQRPSGAGRRRQVAAGDRCRAGRGGLRLPRPVARRAVADRRVAGLFGLGIGLAFASHGQPDRGQRPGRQTGAATGMNANIRTIGGSIGAAVTSVLVTGHLQSSGLP